MAFSLLEGSYTKMPLRMSSATLPSTSGLEHSGASTLSTLYPGLEDVQDSKYVKQCHNQRYNQQKSTHISLLSVFATPSIQTRFNSHYSKSLPHVPSKRSHQRSASPRARTPQRLLLNINTSYP
jgi:DNA topoisomerase IA